MEEKYIKVVELWGIDPGHNVLQIFAHAFEIKICKSGKDSACGRRRTSAFSERTGLRGLEFKVK